MPAFLMSLLFSKGCFTSLLLLCKMAESFRCLVLHPKYLVNSHLSPLEVPYQGRFCHSPEEETNKISELKCEPQVVILLAGVLVQRVL